MYGRVLETSRTQATKLEKWPHLIQSVNVIDNYEIMIFISVIAVLIGPNQNLDIRTLLRYVYIIYALSVCVCVCVLKSC